MKDIFTGLYNKVIGFFQADRAENSKETATNRLKLVLLHDRTNLDTITMQKLREQLIEVISKYIEIDNEALDLSLEGEGDSIALMLNIPVVKARTKEEIEELEKAELEAKEAEIRAAIEAEMAKTAESDADEAESSESEDENLDSEASEDDSAAENEELTENSEQDVADSEETSKDEQDSADVAEKGEKSSAKKKNKK